jgi:endogenous inhibitor of DNA gyrase (YacG/DUF329 family)
MSAPRANCPTCQREIEWSEAFPYRPFCSERCKLVDLDGWLSERNAIAGEAVDLQAQFKKATDQE